MRKWTNEEINFLKEIYTEKFNDEIANIMNQHFNGKYRIYTASSVSAAKDRFKLHSKPKFGRLYRKEIIEFIQCNYEEKDNLELSKLLNEKFNLNTNADKISMLKINLKRRFGINTQTGINRGCYRKGQSPANKGKKWDDYMSKEKQEKSRKTTFKKGNVPHNHKPIGYERINVDGYIEIKVKEPNKFKLKHRVIWEEHFGTIPNGYNVIFKDRNKLNLDINNLALVSKAQMLILNQEKLIYDNPDLTEVGINISKIKERVSDIKNGL